MTTVEMALDPFKEKRIGKPAEQIKTTNTEGALDDRLRKIIMIAYSNRSGAFPNRTDLVLKPHQISMILMNEDILHKHRDSDHLGSFHGFITALVQASYDAGYNEFHLPVSGRSYHLCNELKGTKERPLVINVQSDYANYCAYGMSHVNLTYRGDASLDFANKAKHCFIDFEGTIKKDWIHIFPFESGFSSKYRLAGDLTEVHPGHKSKNCEFEIFTDVGSMGASSKNSTFNLHGALRYLYDRKSGYMSNYSTYTTTDKKSYRTIQWSLGLLGMFWHQNSVRLIK